MDDSEFSRAATEARLRNTAHRFTLDQNHDPAIRKQALTNHAQLLKIAKKANMFLRTDREFRNSQFTNIGPFPIMKCSKDNLSDQAIFVHWLERSLIGENITIATQVKSSQEEPQIRMPAIVLSSHCLQRVMPLLTIRTGTKTPRARSQIFAFP